jgi:hypothetical protein
MKFVVQTNQSAHAYKHKFLSVSSPSLVLKTTLTLFISFSPLLHTELHALQAMNCTPSPPSDPSIIPSFSVQNWLTQTNQNPVAIHVTVSSMCSVQDKTCVIVLSFIKRKAMRGGEMLCSHRSVSTTEIKNMSDVKPAKFIPPIRVPRVKMIMMISCSSEHQLPSIR